MGEEVIKCPNCGADIDPLADKCPFCGYINPEGAENKYMDSLELVRQQLDVVDEEAATEYRKTIGQTVKVVRNTLIVLACLAAVIGAVVLIHHLYKSFMYEKVYKIGEVKDTPEELAWQKNFFKELDELYAVGDYETMCQRYREEGTSHNVWSYEHGPFLETYGDYISLRDRYVPELDEKGRIDKSYAQYMTALALRYYYEVYKDSYFVTGLTEEEVEYLDEIREDYVLDIVYNRMGYTDEALEEVKDDIMGGGYFDWNKAYDLSDKNYKRYR